jgi:metal transporter CNNM
MEIPECLINPDAIKILDFRKNVNFLLTIILWGNVGINVLLTLLSNSVMAGIVAFFPIEALICINSLLMYK